MQIDGGVPAEERCEPPRGGGLGFGQLPGAGRRTGKAEG